MVKSTFVGIAGNNYPRVGLSVRPATVKFHMKQKLKVEFCNVHHYLYEVSRAFSIFKIMKRQ